MPMKRCEADLHFYDMEKHKTCPYCEGQKGDKRPAPRVPEKGEESESMRTPTVLADSGAKEHAGLSDPLQDSPIDGQLSKEAAPGESIPEESAPPPLDSVPEPGARRRSSKSAPEYPIAAEQPGAERHPIAEPEPTGVHDGMTVVVINPLVGWLVCTEGPEMGNDYRIKAGINEIGREPDPEVDIVIRGDSLISARHHAEIQYDPEENIFYLIKSKNEAVKINDAKVKRPTKLSPYDMIQLGDTRLVFVPLCSEKFQWPIYG